jgi:hypothetical protein
LGLVELIIKETPTKRIGVALKLEPWDQASLKAKEVSKIKPMAYVPNNPM